ncbi:hypothetical protein AGMMS49944_30930 [Spirochaetia bacterium]|nr:hypothetical protein AGMMS49944_30930 [Spirochaetia bacterium]
MNTYDGQESTDQKKYLSKDIKYIKERWDNRAGRWDADLKDEKCHLNRSGSYQRFIEILQFEFDKIEPTFKNGCLLDLGCGTGELLVHFASQFHSAIGIDVSSKMLEHAKRKLSEKIILKEGDIFDKKIYPSNVKVVISRGILLSHYGETLAKNLLQLIYSHLAKTGFLFLDVLQKTDGIVSYGKKMYSKQELINLFESVGFSNTTIYGESTYPILYIKAKK